MARRKYGDGSVFLRKDGRWVAQMKLEGSKNKQTYHKSEKEAEASLKKMQRELEQGLLAIGPQQTLKTYLEDWLENVMKPSSRSIATYEFYRNLLEKHVIPSLGYVRLQQLKPQQVQAFYTKKLKEGLSKKRVRAMHAVLHRALENAVKWSLVGRNVCDLVNAPIPVRREIQTLTQEQVQCLLTSVRHHRLEALITVAITTGMRRGELLGLHWQDIDVEKGSLQVRRSVNRVGPHGMIVSEPKTKGSKRNILLPEFVIEVLKEHRVRQQEIKANALETWHENDIVFSNMYGNYLSTTILQTLFKKLLKDAKLPNIRFHDLRHSAATILLGMGVHPKVVQELLGHSNISMTMDTYSHVLPSMQSEAMGKMNGLFKPK